MSSAKKSIFIIAFIALLMVSLTACNLPSNQTPTPEEPNLIHTLAAQTVAAQLTQQSSDGGSVATLPPTVIFATATMPAATATPIPPTATLVIPTATSIPPTATPIPCNLMEYVKDVNYPDGEDVKPGEAIVKSWRLKNIGSCTWTSNYSLIFDHGDAMGAPSTTQLTNGQVPPGGTVDVSVNLTMPSTPGTYQGFYKLRDSYNNVFGYAPNDKAFWVKLDVINPANYDFVAQASNAVWGNATVTLPFGDQNDDTPGIAAVMNNFKLEDNKQYNGVLITYPQRITDGIIQGQYGKYTVKDGDHFRANLGFAADCSGGKVKFQLLVKQGNAVTLLKEWEKSCNGSLMTVDYDLSSLKGNEYNFILKVTADGAWESDKAVWLTPRIQS
jgi:hypothetical protein